MGTPKCESGSGDPWARGRPWGPPSGKAAMESSSKQWGKCLLSDFFKKNQCNLFQEDLELNQQLSLPSRATP